MSPSRKVKVIDTATGQVLREGAVRASETGPQKPLLFGWLEGADILKVGAIVVGAIVFIVNSDNRIKAVEAGQAMTGQAISKLVDFTENSDMWNSSHYGVPFQGGRPARGFGNYNRGSIQPKEQI